MIRFIVKEVYLGHVIHAGGDPETRLVCFDGDQDALERFLRYEDQPEKEPPDYVTRELLGIELLSETDRRSADRDRVAAIKTMKRLREILEGNESESTKLARVRYWLMSSPIWTSSHE